MRPFAVALRHVPRALGVLVAATFATFVFLALVPDNTPTTSTRLGPGLVGDYLDWLGHALTGDFGTSAGYGEPVATGLRRTLPITFLLLLYAQVGALVVAVPLAVGAAWREGGAFDRVTNVVSSGLAAVPVFVAAVILQAAFVIGVLRLGPIPLSGKWLPAVRYVALTDDPLGHARTMLLPSVSLAVVMIPTYLRVLRSDLVATTREDYLVAVRARGLPGRRVLFGHALRPSSGGLCTLVGTYMGLLLSYVLVVEELFTLPGLGDYLGTALARRDQPVVLGVVAAVSALVVVANLAADVVVAALDPRITARGRGGATIG